MSVEDDGIDPSLRQWKEMDKLSAQVCESVNTSVLPESLPAEHETGHLFSRSNGNLPLAFTTFREKAPRLTSEISMNRSTASLKRRHELWQKPHAIVALTSAGWMVREGGNAARGRYVRCC